MAASLGCVLAALTAHAASGGVAAPGTVVAACVVSGALAWRIAGVRLTNLQLLGLLVLCQVGVHMASMAASPHTGGSMGVSMLLTHAGATAISLLALSRGESFVWAVAEMFALRPLRLLLHRHADLPARTTAVSIPATRPRRVHATRVTPVRGPPTGFASVVPSL